MGEDKKKKKVGCFGLLLAIGFFAFIAIGLVMTIQYLSPPDKQRPKISIKKSLSYLNDIPEVEWVEVDGNDVYIGFKERPSDLKLIIHAAAINGNRAHGFGVHVWAVDAKYAGWRPGAGPYWCTATARHGKITDSSCR